MDKRCTERVSSDWYSHQCSRKATVERDGEWYCKQHDPVEVERKRQVKEKQWDEETKQRAEHRRRQDAIQRLCEGVSTDELEKMHPLVSETQTNHTDRAVNPI